MAKKAVKRKKQPLKKKVILFARVGTGYVQIFESLKEKKEITIVTDEDGKVLDRSEEIIEEPCLVELCKEAKRLLGITNGDFQLDITITTVK